VGGKGNALDIRGGGKVSGCGVLVLAIALGNFPSVCATGVFSNLFGLSNLFMRM
jgi:hypothetical protein